MKTALFSSSVLLILLVFVLVFAVSIAPKNSEFYKETLKLNCEKGLVWDMDNIEARHCIAYLLATRSK